MKNSTVLIDETWELRALSILLLISLACTYCEPVEDTRMNCQQDG